jgi:hypothetical protein
VSLDDGEHVFEVRAHTAGGIADFTPARSIFTVDTIPPDTTIAGGPPAKTKDRTPTFSFSATTAGGTFDCRLDAEAFAPCTSPFTTAKLPFGVHTFEVQATDAAGNQDTVAASRSFKVKKKKK